MSRLEELRLAAEAATPGKWGMLPGGPGKMNAIYKDTPASGALAYVGAEWTDAAADAEFITLANPETVLALVALVKELSAEHERVLKITRNSRTAPNVLDTVDFVCRRALASAATWMEE